MDSETVTGNDGASHLVLIACSDGTHVAGEHISTTDALTYLVERDGELWSFFVDYDVNFWIADLPQSALNRLRLTNWTQWQGWRIHHIPRRVFEVWHRPTKRYACVYDAFPFVQSSFVTWLRQWHLASPAVVARVERMKSQRATFARVNRARILRYCHDEVAYIAHGVEQLKARIDAAGLRPWRWLGPGAVAARVLREHATRDHFPRREHPKADGAYFGGRIETSATGIVSGPLHYYDLASAYPAAARTLPCLRHGRWRLRRTWNGNPVALVDVTWRATRGRHPVWGPFPVRLLAGIPLRYPNAGRGIYWGPEVAAWLDSPDYVFQVHRAWVWEPRCKHEPLAWVGELYARRQELKRADDPAEYAFKLVLNSIYGKFAQRVGRAPYRCVEYAGLITATTRAAVGRVLKTHGADVLLVATDGVVTRRPLPADVLGDGLGAWQDAGTYDAADLWQPGFYILDDTQIKTRGFTRHDVDVDALRREWRDRFLLGQATVARRRVVGYRLATHQNRMADLCRWKNETSQVYFWPLPRRAVGEVQTGRRGVWWTTVAPSAKVETAAELRALRDDYARERLVATYADDGEPLGFDRG